METEEGREGEEEEDAYFFSSTRPEGGAGEVPYLAQPYVHAFEPRRYSLHDPHEEASKPSWLSPELVSLLPHPSSSFARRSLSLSLTPRFFACYTEEASSSVDVVYS